MMKKIILYLFLLFSFVVPVLAESIQASDQPYTVLEKQYANNIWGNEKDRVFYDNSADDELQRIRKIAGVIWENKDTLQIEAVDLSEDSIIVTIIQSNTRKENRIKDFVEENFIDGQNVNIIFKNLPRLPDEDILKEYFVADGVRYLACEGKLMKLEHMPYMNKDYLMLPVRDICNILSKVSNSSYKVNWIGGNDKILEVTSSIRGGKVEISVKNNTYKSISYNESVHSFEGTIENMNGTVYVPFSPENLRLIFYVPISENWDEQTRLVRLLL